MLLSAREIINSRVRLVMAIMYAGFGVGVLALVVPQALGSPPLVALAIAGLAVASLTMIGAYLLGIRCPRCQARLTDLLWGRPGLRIDPRIRFCPYCGVELDDEYDSAEHSR